MWPRCLPGLIALSDVCPQSRIRQTIENGLTVRSGQIPGKASVKADHGPRKLHCKTGQAHNENVTHISGYAWHQFLLNQTFMLVCTMQRL